MNVKEPGKEESWRCQRDLALQQGWFDIQLSALGSEWLTVTEAGGDELEYKNSRASDSACHKTSQFTSCFTLRGIEFIKGLETYPAESIAAEYCSLVGEL